MTFGDFRKAAQRQKTTTTGSTSSSRFLRTAFSSKRLTAISAMFEGLPLRAGRFAFSALGTDCSLVLISSARYLDCRNRGTRFLLRDFARGLSSRRGKHPEQQGKQEKHKPLRGKSVHACFMLRLISTGSARPIQREAPATTDRHRKKLGSFSTTHPPNKQRTIRQSPSPPLAVVPRENSCKGFQESSSTAEDGQNWLYQFKPVPAHCILLKAPHCHLRHVRRTALEGGAVRISSPRDGLFSSL